MPDKEKYEALAENPLELFKDCYVVLFPKGMNEIWIGDGNHCGFRIRAEKTKGGVCLHVSNFVGTPPLDVTTHNGSEVVICEREDGDGVERVYWPTERISQIRKVLEN